VPDKPQAVLPAELVPSLLGSQRRFEAICIFTKIAGIHMYNLDIYLQNKRTTAMAVLPLYITATIC
jgi:hypothetical protein